MNRFQHVATARFVMVICLLTSLFCAMAYTQTAQAETMSIEVIQLQSREAKELVPVIKPFMPPGSAITGQGYKLIVKTTPQNLAQIKQMLKELDRRAVQLVISVWQGDAASAKGQLNIRGQVPIYDQAGKFKGRNVKQVRVMDGHAALIQAHAQVPITTTTTRHGVQTKTTGYKTITQGIYVLPRVLKGNKVQLRFEAKQNQLRRSGTVQTGQTQTQIVVPMGKWVNVGAISQSAAYNIRGLIFGVKGQGRGNMQLYLRVDAE